jgi:hypothetical protein
MGALLVFLVSRCSSNGCVGPSEKGTLRPSFRTTGGHSIHFVEYVNRIRRAGFIAKNGRSPVGITPFRRRPKEILFFFLKNRISAPVVMRSWLTDVRGRYAENLKR